MTTILNGSAEMMAADCKAFRPVSPPASNRTKAMAERETPHTTLIIPDGVSEPNDVCIPRTNVAESADVMKNDDTSSIATSDRSSPIGSSSNTPNSCVSGGISKISGTLWPTRSEEHTSELQSRFDLVCRLLLE